MVTPPFAVRGAADDLVLTWFDEEGAHVASSRSEVPPEHRAEVRVDSLRVAPDDRDPDQRLRRRSANGRRARRLHGAPPCRARPSSSTSPRSSRARTRATRSRASDVIIYGASWCGACHEAAAFLRGRGIAFVERDIERDPGAREAMQQAASAAGIPTSSIPIIDFRGTIIRGFDPRAPRARDPREQPEPSDRASRSGLVSESPEGLPSEEDAITTGLAWAGLRESQRGLVRAYLHRDPDEWRNCCGSSCFPCVPDPHRKRGRRTQEARDLLGLPRWPPGQPLRRSLRASCRNGLQSPWRNAGRQERSQPRASHGAMLRDAKQEPARSCRSAFLSGKNPPLPRCPVPQDA